MTKRISRRKRCWVQTLTLPELDQSKTAVLNSLASLPIDDRRVLSRTAVCDRAHFDGKTPAH
jgi:hypothetical protein